MNSMTPCRFFECRNPFHGRLVGHIKMKIAAWAGIRLWLVIRILQLQPISLLQNYQNKLNYYAAQHLGYGMKPFFRG